VVTWKQIAAPHEAGHIAVALELGIPVRSATIKRNLKLKSGGRTEFGKDYPSVKERHRWCIAILAGREAEALYFEEPIPPGTDASDLKAVKHYLLNGGPAYVEQADGNFASVETTLPDRIARLRRRARRLVRQPLVRLRIERLRLALLKQGSLSASEIERLR
jgi:hypothetical protein